MRFNAAILTILILFAGVSRAQDTKEKDRPRLFKGGLIKRFEGIQEKLKKDREERKKSLDEDRSKNAKAREDKLRQLNERLAEEFRKSGLKLNLDSFAFGKNADKAPPANDRNPEAPRFNPPQMSSNQGIRNAAAPRVAMGIEVTPGGIGKSGLTVDRVDRNGAAGLAGIRPQDRIVSVGGSSIKKVDDLQMIMEAFEPGDRTEVELVRNGKKEKVLVEFPGSNPNSTNRGSVALNPAQGVAPQGGRQGRFNGSQGTENMTEELPTPGSNSNDRPATNPSGSNPPPVLPLLQAPEQGNRIRTSTNPDEVQPGVGVTAVAVDPALFAARNLNVREGAYLEIVEKGSAAEKAGLKPGDVVIALDGRKVDSAVTMAELVQTYKPGDKAQVLYYRENRLKRAKIEIDSVRVAEFRPPVKPIREAQNQSERNRPSSSRKTILGGLGDEFPRLKKVENLINQFSGQEMNGDSQAPMKSRSESGQNSNPVTGKSSLLAPGQTNREVELEDEVQSLRSRVKGQDQQIQSLNEKLQAIEKLLSERNKKEKSNK